MHSNNHSSGKSAVMVALIGYWMLGLAPVFADDPFEGRLAKPADSDQGAAGSATFLQRWFRRRDGQWEQHWSVHEVREGDIIFFQCQSRLWQTTFATFGSPGPTHVAIVVKMDDGQLGLLQAVDPQLKFKSALKHPGYKAGQVCLSPDVTGFLRQYDGRIWVRPLRGSLHPATSQRLTAWARHQVGKPYGMDKLIGPPLGLPVQVLHLGGPAQVDGHWWFCSELVASGLVVTGHLSPWHVRPSRVDPEDLFSDRLLKLQPAWEPPLLWSTRIPANLNRPQPGLATTNSGRAEIPIVLAGQQQGVARAELARLTIQNPTNNHYRLTINGQFFGDLRPNQAITATGPAGSVELVARPSSIHEPILILSSRVQADATWSLNPTPDRTAAPNQSARR